MWPEQNPHSTQARGDRWAATCLWAAASSSSCNCLSLCLVLELKRGKYSLVQVLQRRMSMSWWWECNQSTALPISFLKGINSLGTLVNIGFPSGVYQEGKILVCDPTATAIWQWCVSLDDIFCDRLPLLDFAGTRGPSSERGCILQWLIAVHSFSY